MSVDAYLASSFVEAMTIVAFLGVTVIVLGAFIFLVGNSGDV